ncbi:MAG: DUF1877 family protein [Planctomycetia bacterium]|nr:DUF1877 family protein [Planctomycetia bacterium]
MACRGYFTALQLPEAATLLELKSVDERLEFINSLFAIAENDGRVLLVDKSWDAMHRCLCGGWLDAKHSDESMRSCVMGARQLSNQANWIISYVDPDLVRRVNNAINAIEQPWFRSQYFALGRIPRGFMVHRYEIELTETDFEYTWEYFVEVKNFYRAAVHRGLAIVFAVDQ